MTSRLNILVTIYEHVELGRKLLKHIVPITLRSEMTIFGIITAQLLRMIINSNYDNIDFSYLRMMHDISYRRFARHCVIVS